MLVLALDCSTRTGSVAVARHGTLLESRVGDPAVRHAARLPGDAISLLDAHGYRLADVDLLAAVSGPGGFTGLRVGLATMQGLAVGLNRPVVLVSTLELLARAAAAADEAPILGAWMHGMRGEIFTALYDRPSAAHGMDERLAPTVGSPDACLSHWAEALHTDAGPIAVAGDAAHRDLALLETRLARPVRLVSVPPLAAVLAVIAPERRGEAVAPAAVRPTYVRRPDAVQARLDAGLPVGPDAG